MVQASALAQVAPSQANFGSVRVGSKTSDERKIRVRNTGTSPLRSAPSASTGRDFVTKRLQVDPGGGKSCEMNVSSSLTAVERDR